MKTGTRTPLTCAARGCDGCLGCKPETTRETTLSERAKLIAWPHSESLEPTAADALIGNIEEALRTVESEVLERAAKVAESELYADHNPSKWIAENIRKLSLSGDT